MGFEMSYQPAGLACFMLIGFEAFDMARAGVSSYTA